MDSPVSHSGQARLSATLAAYKTGEIPLLEILWWSSSPENGPADHLPSSSPTTVAFSWFRRDAI